MDIEKILNDALNKALITDKIKGVPSSNKIADFVNKYAESKQLTTHSVVRSVFLIQHRDTLINHGLFSTMESAKKFVGKSKNFHIQEVNIH